MKRTQGRVLFYVQHLLGIGHLKRSAVIARAMASAGLDVHVALGGPMVEGVAFDGCNLIHLPPVHTLDEAFVLLDERDKPVDDAWRARRRDQLIAKFDALRPEVLLIEMFPFGRRQFQFELMPLIETADSYPIRPRIMASVRDILVHKAEPDKNQEMVTLARAWFDQILVHGDPSFVPLDATFPEAIHIADKLVYTGYVVDVANDTPAAAIGNAGTGEVLVSAGGGAVGAPLLRAALACRPLSQARDLTWRLIAGHNLPEADFQSLAAALPDGVILERWRTDLPAMFGRCALSISQGGYNTVLDVLAAHCRSVIVPFAAGKETEQTYRAEALAARGALVCVDPASLSPKVLATAVDTALTLSPSAVDIDCHGAATTASLIAATCLEVAAG